MTPEEAEKAIICQTRTLFAGQGYHRRKLTWYRYDRQFLQLIDMQLGQQAITIKLGAVYRPWNHATHPPADQCDIVVGMGSIVPPMVDWRLIREYRRWTSSCDNCLAQLLEVIEHAAMPVLDAWRSVDSIRDFLETSVGAKCTVSRGFSQHLAGDSGNRQGR
jgi:hypothetical protein